MKKDEIDIINGPIWLNLIRFTIPICMMSVLQILFVACDDMAILGMFAGSKSLAAVGATNYVINLFINTFSGLAVGINVVVATYIGESSKEKTEQAVHTAVTSAIMFGLILLVTGYVCSYPILRLMHTPEDILQRSTLYLRIFFFGTPATLLINFGSAVLRANGNSKHPFYFLCISGCLDILLNLLFVAVFHLDVAGVALGTLISQYFNATLILYRLLHEKSFCHLRFSKLKIWKEPFLSILRIGIPAGLNNFVFSFSNMQIQSAINTFGSSAVAGCSAATTVESFVYAATNSVMQGAITFTSQNNGAKNYNNIRCTLKYCLLYASLIGTVLGGIAFLSGKRILSFFIDPADIPYAIIRNRIILLPYMFCGIMETLSGVLRGLGKTLIPTLVTVFFACFFRILWVYTVFPVYRSLAVLFLSFPLSWIMTAAAHLVYYLLVRSRINQDISDPVKKL